MRYLATVARLLVAPEIRAHIAEQRLSNQDTQPLSSAPNGKGSSTLFCWTCLCVTTNLTQLCQCRVKAVENDTDLTEEELEEKMEQFMRSQADRESGKLPVLLCPQVSVCYITA